MILNYKYRRISGNQSWKNLLKNNVSMCMTEGEEQGKLWGNTASHEEINKGNMKIESYAAAKVNDISSIRQILCEWFDPLPLMLIPHPKHRWIMSAKPNEINHRTARMKPAAPVNPTDCRYNGQLKLEEKNLPKVEQTE